MPQPPRVYKTPAIVLRQRKLGDADKIITLYTASYGKLDAVAKGVRRLTSRLAGHVQPLNHGSYLLAHGRNLDIITQAQSIETFQPLRDDLGRLSYALYAAELLDRATEERAENFAVYRLLLDTLRRVATRNDIDVVLRYSDMSLLMQLGSRPGLRRGVFRVVTGLEWHVDRLRLVQGAGGRQWASRVDRVVRLLRRTRGRAEGHLDTACHLRIQRHRALDREVTVRLRLGDVRDR